MNSSYSSRKPTTPYPGLLSSLFVALIIEFHTLSIQGLKYLLVKIYIRFCLIRKERSGLMAPSTLLSLKILIYGLWNPLFSSNNYLCILFIYLFTFPSYLTLLLCGPTPSLSLPLPCLLSFFECARRIFHRIC